MNKLDLEKIKEELEQQKQENDEKIILYDERTRMANVNSFESKTDAILAFSLPVYSVIVPISAILIKVLDINAFTNIIPALSFTAIAIGGSLGVGNLIRTLFEKNIKQKRE